MLRVVHKYIHSEYYTRMMVMLLGGECNSCVLVFFFIIIMGTQARAAEYRFLEMDDDIMHISVYQI